jgi:integrase
MARYYVILPNGSKKRQQIIKKDREEVVRLLHEELSRKEQGVPIYKDKARTVEAMCDYFIREIDPHLVRITTYRHHADHIKRLIVPHLGKMPLSNLKPEHVREWMNTLVKLGVGKVVIKRSRETLSAVLREAVKLEYIQRNVARLAQPPKVTPKEKHVWTSEQAACFLEKICDHEYYPIFLTLFHYGLRKSESMGLRWRDVDFDNNEIHIRFQRLHFNNERHLLPLKTKASLRDLPMSAEIRAVLLDEKAKYDVAGNTDEFVFRNKADRPVDPSSLGAVFRYLQRTYDMPYITLHEIRHTVATMLKDQGVSPKDAQNYLGHSCISTTLSVYTHTSDANKVQAIESIAHSLSKQPVAQDDASPAPKAFDFNKEMEDLIARARAINKDDERLESLAQQFIDSNRMKNSEKIPQTVSA